MARLAASVLAILLIAIAPARGADRVALVIGNAAYRQAPALSNTLRDAEAVAAAFGRLGFEVILELDATQPETLAALDRFAAAMRGAEAAVFYYSGHGIQVSGENYLLPVDIDIRSERSLRYGAVNVADVVHDMERSAEVSLVILDACRDNPFTDALQQALPATRSAAVTRGLALIKPEGSGTIIAYAAAAGHTASDGTGDHSPYTQALLEEMPTPDVEVGLLFRRVAGKVVEATGGEQRPELLVRLTREFYLSRSRGAVAAAPPPPAPAPAAPAPAEAAATAENVAPEAFRGWESAGLLPTRVPLYETAAPWTPSAPRHVEEQDPNDSFGEAQPIGVTDRVTGRIMPRRDTDWYRFEVAQGGELHVAAGAMPATLDLNVRLHDANKRVVGNWIGAPRNGGDLDATFDIAVPGTYWLEVADGRGDGEAEESFELALGYLVQADLYEPNDTFGTARAIPLDGAFEANILPLRDTDWYRLQTRAPGELSVTARSVAENLEVFLRVHDADGQIVGNWTGPTRPGGDTLAVFDLPRPGDYRLEVADSRNDQRSIDPFLVTTSFVASNDGFEPNDSFGAAAPLPLDGIERLTVFPQRDTDWLRIDVDHPGELQFAVTRVPPDLDVNVRVHDQDKQVIRNWVAPPRMGGDTVGFADLPRPGRYYLEIADGRNDARSIQPVRLETRFIPAADQYEPNDSYGLATPISAGGEIAFNILPLRDADWFQIRVTEPGELGIVIDEGPQDLDIHYRVWDADKKVIANWVAPYSMGGLTEGFADLPAPGAYYIEVADGRNDGRSIRHATLATRFAPTQGSGEPNDSFGAANEVPLEGETAAHILPVRDTDWHRFLVPGPGELRVHVTGVDEALDIHVRLFDAEMRTVGNWIGPGAPGGDTNAVFTVKQAGWHWLEIADGRNDARSPAPFHIRRSFTPTPQ